MVVGRDLRADMRITHPLISRAHLLLRYDQGKWLAIDNGSLNGTFVNGRRVPVVEIHDGCAINIGNPDGPLLTFDVGRHQGMAGRPPRTESMGIPVAAHPPAPAAWSAQPAPPVAARPRRPAHPNWAAPPRRRSRAAPGRRARPCTAAAHPAATRPPRRPRRPSHRPRRPRTPRWRPRLPSRPRWPTWRPRCSRR
ncbi:FHA domain protein [Mycobacterium avium MAV_120809_2495]|nr:FHA domain protein [Mycobacterium avium MAV_120809_2495]